MHPSDWATERSLQLASDLGQKSAGRRAAVGLGQRLRRLAERASDSSDPDSILAVAMSIVGVLGVRRSAAMEPHGLLLQLEDGFRIVLKEGQTVERHRWTVAHEMGHTAIPYPYAGVSDAELQEIEYRCDKFARELLMPRPQFSRAFQRPSEDPLGALDSAARQFGVSFGSAIIRIREVRALESARSLVALLRSRSDEAPEWVFDEVAIDGGLGVSVEAGLALGDVGVEESVVRSLPVGGIHAGTYAGLRFPGLNGGLAVRSGRVQIRRLSRSAALFGFRGA